MGLWGIADVGNGSSGGTLSFTWMVFLIVPTYRYTRWGQAGWAALAGRGLG